MQLPWLPCNLPVLCSGRGSHMGVEQPPSPPRSPPLSSCAVCGQAVAATGEMKANLPTWKNFLLAVAAGCYTAMFW